MPKVFLADGSIDFGLDKIMDKHQWMTWHSSEWKLYIGLQVNRLWFPNEMQKCSSKKRTLDDWAIVEVRCFWYCLWFKRKVSFVAHFLDTSMRSFPKFLNQLCLMICTHSSWTFPYHTLWIFFVNNQSFQQSPLMAYLSTRRLSISVFLTTVRLAVFPLII